MYICATLNRLAKWGNTA